MGLGMPTKKTILVDIDPTMDDHPAMDRAIWLAQHYDAVLELFICDYDPYIERNKAREELLRYHRGRLSDLATIALQAGVTATTDVVWDHPIYAALIRKAVKTKPIMVVKDTHYHPALKRTIFSNTDWNLIRHCPVDLLLVKPAALSQPVRLMASVDPLHEHDKPADLDQRIMSVAKDLSSRVGGELSVFHAFDPAAVIASVAPTLATPIEIPLQKVTDAFEKRHRQALDELTERFDVPADRVHLHQGRPDQLLPTLVEKQRTDIAVMGAISRRGLKRIFIGHTAERVLDRLPCDLLIVKPTGFLTRVSSHILEAA